jgi:hypothetical protein
MEELTTDHLREAFFKAVRAFAAMEDGIEKRVDAFASSNRKHAFLLAFLGRPGNSPATFPDIPEGLASCPFEN